MNAVESLLRAHIRDARAAIAEAVARVDALEKQFDNLDFSIPEPVKRTHKLDGWSAEEDAVLREHYRELGAVGCHELLPHRTESALRTRASRVLKIQTMPSAQRLWCNQCEAKVTYGQVATCRSKFCEGKKIVAAEGGQ